MKLNKKLQLGLLFAFYLSRSGKTTIASAAEGLKASRTFLEQVARELRLKGVVRSTRGPSGGYELIGEPFVGDVFRALSSRSFNTPASNMHNYESRTLNHLIYNLNDSLNPVLNRKVKNVGMDLIAADSARLNRTSPSAGVN